MTLMHSPSGMAEVPVGAGSVETMLWDMSLDMLATLTLDGYLTRVNPAWEQTLGYSPDELMAGPYLTFVHPDDVARTMAEAAAPMRPWVASLTPRRG